MKSLLEHCTTDRQRQIIQAIEAAGGSCTRAAEQLGLHRSYVHRILRQIEARADCPGHTRKEKAPELPPEQEHRLVEQNKLLKRDNTQLQQRVVELENINGLLQAGQSDKPVKPRTIKRSGKKPLVAATAFLSDTHFDEVVEPAQIGGVNAYNRDIAARRLQRFVEKTATVAHDLFSGFEIRHLDLPLGGDMISGNIHDELARSNDAEVMETCRYWSDQIARVIVTLAGEFETVFVPAVVGNHGRNTKKPRHKGRVQDNFDWLIYQWTLVRVQASGVDNVHWSISESPDVSWQTMGHRYLMTHGDQASGGSGWGGIFSPIMRLYEKKLKSYAGRGIHFDTLIMGHWHQWTDTGTVVVNGSLKGFDEFAHNLNFRPEPPQQGFWLTDPKHGRIFSGPLLVADGESEYQVAA